MTQDIDRLIEEVERLRAECDAFKVYRALTTTALGIEPASCADDVREAIEGLRADVARLRAAMVEGEPHSNPDKVFAMVNAERIRRGLFWRDLASHIGVAPSTLSRWAHGKMLSLPAHLRVCQWLKKAVRDTVTSDSEQGEGVAR